MNQIVTALVEADPFSSWWPYLVAILVGIVMTVKTFMGGQMCPNQNQKLEQQTILITGATGGIGSEIVKELCQRSVARLILACRDLAKGNKTKEQLKKTFPNVVIDVRRIDLQSLNSVRQFVQSIQNDYQQIDVLINNAGGKFPIGKTVDDFEPNLQVNYLSHFLLTYLLLPLMKQSKQGRIINITAHAYASVKLSGNNSILNCYENDKSNAFALSKCMIVAGSVCLAEQLKGSSVTVNVFTPGVVRGTGHYQGSQISSAICPKLLIFPWMWLFMKTPQQGAQTAIYLAVEPTLNNVSGQLFNDCERIVVAEHDMNDKIRRQLLDETLKALEISNCKF